MWLLKKLNEDVIKYLISDNKLYTLGRKNCDFTLENDASLSRKHCTIYIAKQSECPVPVNTFTGVWLVDEKSKYGTYIKNNNDWVKINPNENRKLGNGTIIKFGLMDNIWRLVSVWDIKANFEKSSQGHWINSLSCWKMEFLGIIFPDVYNNFNCSLEFKPVVACASGIPTDQKKSIESFLQSIDSFLRNAWCKECSLVIVNEITLTVKVVLALINGIPIVTPNYIEKLVECVKNKDSLPDYEDYRPVIKESILNKSLVSLDTKNNRKHLFKGIKFVIPTRKQLETLKDVITSAGGSVELLSSKQKMEKFAEDNIVVIQLPLSNTGIPEDLCKLFKEISIFLKKNFGKRVIPESEIAQAVAYSSTEKFCNPKTTCFNLRIGEKKQVDLGPVIVEETPFVAEEAKHLGCGVIPSSEDVQAEPLSNTAAAPQLQSTTKSQLLSDKVQIPCVERKRTHSPNPVDHEFLKKKARGKAVSNDNDSKFAKVGHSSENEYLQSKRKTTETFNPSKANQTKPSFITNYFQKQNKPSAEENSQLIRQASTSFWNCDTVTSKLSKRKISIESDDSEEDSNSSRKKTKRPTVDMSKPSTPELAIETPREVVEVLENINSRNSVSIPSFKKVIAEEDDDQTGYFGKKISDDVDLQVNDLNNTILSLTIISPAFLKSDGTLIDPPSEPVNVKRFKKQKIFSSAILSSLEEVDDELSDGEWIEPHSDRFNISAIKND